jgi:hypothetical protein
MISFLRPTKADRHSSMPVYVTGSECPEPIRPDNLGDLRIAIAIARKGALP